MKIEAGFLLKNDTLLIKYTLSTYISNQINFICNLNYMLIEVYIYVINSFLKKNIWLLIIFKIERNKIIFKINFKK